MSLSTEMQGKIYQSLTDGYSQVKFFQDEVVILDDEKSTWDNAIFKIDKQIIGEIDVVNRAIEDVYDLYAQRLTGVTSCRTDLFWMMTNQGVGAEPYTLRCVKVNPKGYTDIVREYVGIDSNFFYWINPATNAAETAPMNAAVAEELGMDVNSLYMGLNPKNLYGLKYYHEPYANDIGDTFVTSFIGTIASGSNRLTVMNPVGTTGQDPSVSPIYEVGNIVTCEEDGVFGATTKIVGISTGTADLKGLPTITGIATTTTSSVNILTLSATAGLAVSSFDSVSFRVLGDPDTGPVGRIGDVTSNGEVYQANKSFVALASTSNLGGRGATFAVHTNASGGIATVGYSTIYGGVTVDVIGSGGLGYSVGDTITIGGTSLNLANGKAGSAADNLTFTVASLQAGRMKYAFKLSENPENWPDPHDPQTVGIMSSNNLGHGIQIALDNSGAPKGEQGWDARLNGFEIPMDPSNFRILTKVVPPNVGADKSYWPVGFQTAPTASGIIAFEGQTTNVSLADIGSGTMFAPVSACSAGIAASIATAVGIVSTKEEDFLSNDGLNKLRIDAANALREEKSEICMRIWGNRQALGDLNNKITRLESLKGYIMKESIQDLIDE
tara:strand:- start:59 stop:1891 length:1833 start_codon:yes stop_codon:yes gene_type:complete